MLRNLLTCLLLSLLTAPCVLAQEWALKMFNTAEHDFGTVARGAKAIYRFQIKNLYEEDVHIVSVRSSCGCTTPLITKPDLKTFEVGEIVAEFNTKKFLGPKSAVVTVVLDKPFPAEVQLRINGFIRSDVVFAPGAVDFGTVGFGNGAEKRVTVTYAGRDNWSVVETKAPPGLETEIVEVSRARGQVVYELLVRLNKQAPSGYIQDQITLVTNDTRNPEIPLDVEGHVVSEIAVSPAALFLGVVQPGQQVAKTVMVRGRRPFKITGIKCDDASFDIDVAEAARPKVLHQLTVQFTAGAREGKITQQIGIETDQGATPTFSAFAQVIGDDQPVPAHAAAAHSSSVQLSPTRTKVPIDEARHSNYDAE